MEIKDIHVNVVMSIFAFSLAFYFVHNPLLAAVFAFGAYRAMSRRNENKQPEEEV